MSVKVTRRAWKSRTRTAADRLVLLALADFANDEGEAWPTVPNLAEKCNLGVRTVNRSVTDLVSAGLLELRRRPNKSNVYTVLPGSVTPDARPARLAPQDKPARPANLTPPTPANLAPQESNPVMPLRAEPKDSIEMNYQISLQIEDPQPEREDVNRLCETLVELMIVNGCRPPTITDGWRKEARLLLDKDRIDLTTALAVLAWSQADSFWKTNIHSMRKFRAQFDTLRMRAEQSPRALPVSADSINAWLRDCWRNGDVKSIGDRSGIDFPHPDIPASLEGREAISEWLRDQRRQWIDLNRSRITEAVKRRHGGSAA